jgi:hypothetical protein
MNSYLATLVSGMSNPARFGLADTGNSSSNQSNNSHSGGSNMSSDSSASMDMRRVSGAGTHSPEANAARSRTLEGRNTRMEHDQRSSGRSGFRYHLAETTGANTPPRGGGMGGRGGSGMEPGEVRGHHVSRVPQDHMPKVSTRDPQHINRATIAQIDADRAGVPLDTDRVHGAKIPQEKADEIGRRLGVLKDGGSSGSMSSGSGSQSGASGRSSGSMSSQSSGGRMGLIGGSASSSFGTSSQTSGRYSFYNR